MTKCLKLSEVVKKDKNQVGGKASRLAELDQAGFRVPKAFCLKVEAYDEFLKRNKLLPQVRLLRLGRDKSLLKNICLRLTEEISQGSISGVTRKEILSQMKQMKVNRFAVRSSANCEDLQLSSFAGQFESYLDILTDQVFVSIRKCWASVFSRRVLTYTMFHEIELSQVKMAVLVQEMVKADKGGVMFTKEVINGVENQVMIEASRGSADDVVAGLVEPERVMVDKNTKKVKSWETPDGKVLSRKEAFKLTELGLKVEDYYQGVPQDIEWVMRKGKIYLLQSRPITV